MRFENFTYWSVPILLIFVTVLSLVIFPSPVSAATATPPPSSITVQQGDQFLIRGSVTFNVADTQGYFFYGPVYWYAASQSDNFVLENTPSVYWTSGGTGVGNPVENIQISNYAIVGGWQVDISDNGDGLAVDGTFNVDIWLRAKGSDGTLHAVGHENIYFAANQITFFEPSPGSVPAGPITVAIATEATPSPPPTSYTTIIMGAVIGLGIVVVILLMLKRRALHS